MEKPIIYYKVVAYTHPVAGEAVYRPQIVAREQTIPLDEITRSSIDRSLIAGLKSTAAHTIAQASLRLCYSALNLSLSVLASFFLTQRSRATEWQRNWVVFPCDRGPKIRRIVLAAKPL